MLLLIDFSLPNDMMLMFATRWPKPGLPSPSLVLIRRSWVRSLDHYAFMRQQATTALHKQHRDYHLMIGFDGERSDERERRGEKRERKMLQLETDLIEIHEAKNFSAKKIEKKKRGAGMREWSHWQVSWLRWLSERISCQPTQTVSKTKNKRRRSITEDYV